MTLYELGDVGPLTAPALIVAFNGWVSAGFAGTTTAEHLAGDGPVVGRFDQDALFDYRANRPTVDFVEGVMQDVAWPEVTLRHRTVDGRDLLVLSGTEPNGNWRRLAAEVADLALRLGVVEQVSLGGVPWATAHTRPTSVITTASRADAIPTDADHPEGLLRVPGAAVTIIESYVADTGIPTFGFWARVPHYVGSVYYPAVVALVERVATHLGIVVDSSSLVDEAAEQRRQLDEIIESRPQARAIVEQLEQLADEAGEVSGEELAAEIERFLRDRSTGSGPFTEG